MMLEIVIFSILFLFQSSISAKSSDTIVELPNGKINGKDHGYYYSYESIPYAEPPIGPLRFEAPREYNQTWTTEFDATYPPKICMQWNQFIVENDKLVGEEDCLVVNIYKPKKPNLNEDQNQDAEQRFPVLVFIHGGAFMFGSTMTDDHTLLMRRGHFIIVKFTYRVGPLGFLSTEDDVIPGNYGLKDQRMALKWIKRNIASFGGDANSVTLMGFSAGGASVHYQLLQPDLGDYARSAISISGNALCPWAFMRNARSRAFQLGRNLNCSNLETSANLKKCLLERSAKDIVRSVRDFYVFGYNPFTTFGPVVEPVNVDGAFLTASPEDIIRAGNNSNVPWLTSYVAQDGGFNAAELLRKIPRRDGLIEELNDRWYDIAPYMFFYRDTMSSVEELDDRSMALKNQYMGEREFSMESYLDLQRMFTDVNFKNGTEKSVRLHGKYGKSPVFAYLYDNAADENMGNLLAQRKNMKFGTVHGDDLNLIMPSVVRTKKPRDDESVISQKLAKMLEDFVDNGSELTYDNCKFVNNVGQEKLFLMVITKNGCEVKKIDKFP